MKRLTDIFFFLFAIPLLAQTVESGVSSSALERVIDSVVHADMKAARAPGAMILVSREGKPLFEKAYGLRSAKTKEPVNPSTLFLTASVTKTLTTTTLLLLCHEKGISTETSLGTLMDSLPSEIATLSIHQILSQASGILDHKPLRKKWKNDARAYFEHYGNRLFCEELEGVFSYTNYGHVLAGMLIQKLTGSPFEDVVQERIFDPLNMTRSTYSVIDERWVNHASAHQAGKTVKHNYTFPMIKSSASMFSTAGDLSRFANCFMNQGQYQGKQVIPPEVIEKMSGHYTPVGVLHNYFGYPDSQYGYGLMSFTFRGSPLIGHPGETTTQNLLLAMSPSTQTSFVLMSNAGTYPFIQTFEYLAERFLSLEDQSEQSKEAEQNKEAQQGIEREKPSETAIKAYTGRYFTPDITGDRRADIEVYSRGDNLYLELSEEDVHKLEWIEGDLFRYESPQLKFPLEVLFYRDDKQTVRYLNHYWRTSVKIKS